MVFTMFRKTVKEVERQTKNGRIYTRETTWGCFSNRRRKRKTAVGGVDKIKGWVRNEVTEVRNTLIEATFNSLWHTPLCLTITAYLTTYWPYLLVLIPGLPQAVAVAAAAFISYLIAALILSYARRLVVWGAGKIKELFGGSGKQ